MEKTTVFQNECATLVYYPETHIVHNTFRGQPTGEQFREALNAGVEVMRKYGGSKWLSDDRENKVIFSAEDQEWADNDWFPRMTEVGWKTWAMVMPFWNDYNFAISLLRQPLCLFQRTIWIIFAMQINNVIGF